MIWVLFAILAGILFAIQSEINKHYKIDGFLLNAVQSLLTVFLLLPFVGLMEWPNNPTYYLIVLLCAATGTVSMMALYNLAAKQSGRVACLYQPLSVIMTFLLWLLMDPDQQAFLSNNPASLLLIILSFAVFVCGLVLIRRNDIGWQALLAVLPIAVLFSVGIVLTKLFLDQGKSPFWISVNFVFLISVSMCLFSFPVLLSKNIKAKQVLITPYVLRAGILIAVFHTVSWIFINLAIIYAPNPAFVSMMDGLIPVWFMLYYKARGIPDDASPKAGLLIAASAIMILLAMR